MTKSKLIRGIIYKRTSPSGKSYIGQTIDENRRNNEWNNLKRPYSGGVINNARKKYGPENFKYEVLFEIESIDKDSVQIILDEKEIYYIEKFKTYDLDFGYNLCEGGKGGYILNNEYVRKNDHYYRGLGIVQLTIKGKMVKIWKDVYEASLSLSLKSINIINCCNNKIMTAYKYRWMFKSDYDNKLQNNDDFSLNIKTNKYGVVQLDLSGNFIKEFSSATEASKITGINDHSITSVCRNNPNHKTAGGYRWVFKSDYDSGDYNKDLIYKEKIYKKVIQFSLSGEIIKVWDSVREAAEYFNTDNESIRTAADMSTNTKSSNNFRWMYEDDYKKFGNDFMKDIKKPSSYKVGKVIQLDLDGNYIKTWKSGTEAANNLKIDRHGIAFACKKEMNDNYYSGYRWMYESDYDNNKELPTLKINPINRACIPVIKLDMDENYICEYESFTTAGLGSVFNYSYNIGKKIIVYKGFKWIRKEDYLELQKQP